MSWDAVEIPPALAGERLDRVLSLVFDLSRAEAARLISEGKVRVDGVESLTRSRRVASGDRLEADRRAAVVIEDLGQVTAVDVVVVFADDDLIVVDKPAGVVVHPGAGHRDDTLLSGLIARFPELGVRDGLGDPARPGIVHRLDKETSGLLVIARSARAFTALSAQLATRTMGRTYLALALGTIESEEGRIEAPIGRSIRDRKRMAVRVGGREATTRYRVLERFGGAVAATYLEVALDTGRTHQIRVHMSAIGHPVAGDARYGGSAGGTGLRRPFLHAAQLRLVHPTTGIEERFSSALPNDLDAVLHLLRNGE